jgi:hypothetical protein
MQKCDEFFDRPTQADTNFYSSWHRPLRRNHFICGAMIEQKKSTPNCVINMQLDFFHYILLIISASHFNSLSEIVACSDLS